MMQSTSSGGGSDAEWIRVGDDNVVSNPIDVHVQSHPNLHRQLLPTLNNVLYQVIGNKL